MALKVSFGQGGQPAQWYLPGTPVGLLSPGPPGGQGPVADALTAGPYAPAWDDAHLFGGLVEADTLGGTAHSFDVVGGWNSVKNAFAQSDQAEELRFDGFVQVDIDVGRGDPGGDSLITVIGAKRGNIVTGEGDDIVRVELLSNETTWSTEFRIVAGGGDDVVELQGLDRDRELAAGDTTYASFANGANGVWDTSGVGMKSFVDLGGGNDRFIGHGSDDDVIGREGNDVADGGGGTDTWLLAGNRNEYEISYVAGRAIITHVNPVGGVDDGRDDLGGFEKLRFGDGSEMTLAPLPEGLVLWNRLGSAAEVATSEIGPAGTLAGGSFVPGVFGGGWRATGADASLYYQRPPGLDGLGFPSSVINAPSGTIEFWARLEGFSGWISSTGTMPGLIATIPVQDSETGPGGTWILAFTANDGGGGYGLSGQAGDRNFTATNATFTPSYEGILGGDATGWHHYAFSWNADGFAELGQPEREVMLFLDGVPVSSHWEERVDSGVGYGTGELILPLGEVLALAIDGPAWPAGTAVTFDNLKVWSIAKTDFSDRFDEDTGAGGAEPTPIAPVDLADIARGIGGFMISAETGLEFAGAGWSVAGASDVNGDGLDDMLISAYLNDTYVGIDNGEAYVVFGRADARTGMVSLDDIAAGDGTLGFKIIGDRPGDFAGFDSSGAGDVNGDGLQDLIIGAYEHDGAGRTDSGAAYAVFGGTRGSSVQLSDINGAGASGFKIIGENAGDRAGFSVSGGGDINGDGLADLVIGALNNPSKGTPYDGAAYVVFGKASNETVDLRVIAAGGTSAGFKILAEGMLESIGDVSHAGDINGDGLADIVIGNFNGDGDGTTQNGAAFVVFGKSDGEPLDLAKLALPGNGQGFKIIGENQFDTAGAAVSAAGDVNGDGFDDLIVGASGNDRADAMESGAAYVIFGGRQSTPVDLDDVAAGGGGRGFKIVGESAGDYAGFSVSGAGDIDDDGKADLLVGAWLNDSIGRTNSGAAYVVFGKSDGAAVDLRMVAEGNSQHGFKMLGPEREPGRNASLVGSAVADAGDVNGDGLADLMIGAPFFPGNVYVVLGQADWLA